MIALQTQLNEVQQIVQKSENLYRQNNLQSKKLAINKLQEARQKLKDFKKKKSKRRLSFQHNFIQRPSYQITYKHNLATLYYQLNRYQQSFFLYYDLYQKNYVTGPEFLKKIGDCLRHLNDFQGAMKYYNLGLNTYKQKNDQFYYCLGLLALAQGDYDLAIENFYLSTEQPHQVSCHCLYFLGLAAVFLCKRLIHQFRDYIQGIEINQNIANFASQLSIQNIGFLKCLTEVYNNFEKLSSQKSILNLTRAVRKCIQAVLKQSQTNIKNPNQPINFIMKSKQAKYLQDQNVLLKQIDSTENAQLKDLYDSMMGEFKKLYNQSFDLFSKRFQLNFKNIAHLNNQCFLLIISSQSQQKQFDSNKIIKQICNVSKFSINEIDLINVASKSIIYFMRDYKKQLIQFNPENEVSNWLNYLQNLSKINQKQPNNYIQEKLQKYRLYKPISIYGQKLIIDLFSQYIMNGNIYKEQNALLPYIKMPLIKIKIQEIFESSVKSSQKNQYSQQ